MAKKKYYLTNGTRWAAYADPGYQENGAKGKSITVTSKKQAQSYASREEALKELGRNAGKFKGMSVREETASIPDTSVQDSGTWILQDGKGNYAAYRKAGKKGAYAASAKDSAYAYPSEEEAQSELRRCWGQFHGMQAIRMDKQDQKIEALAIPQTAGTYQAAKKPSAQNSTENKTRDTGWLLASEDGKRWAAYRDPEDKKGACLTENLNEAYQFTSEKKAIKAAAKKKKFAGLIPVQETSLESKGRIAVKEDDMLIAEYSLLAEPTQGKPGGQAKPAKRRQFTPEERKAVYRKTEGHCYMCGEFVDFDAFEVDHYIPRSHGGPNTLDNLWCSCHTCNRVKGCTDPEVFFPQAIRIAKHLARKGENATNV